MDGMIEKFITKHGGKILRDSVLSELKRIGERIDKTDTVEMLNLLDSGIMIDLKKLKKKAIAYIESEIRRT
jgi:hypothetical protein